MQKGPREKKCRPDKQNHEWCGMTGKGIWDIWPLGWDPLGGTRGYFLRSIPKGEWGGTTRGEKKGDPTVVKDSNIGPWGGPTRFQGKKLVEAATGKIEPRVERGNKLYYPKRKQKARCRGWRGGSLRKKGWENNKGCKCRGPHWGIVSTRSGEKGPSKEVRPGRSTWNDSAELRQKREPKKEAGGH